MVYSDVAESTVVGSGSGKFPLLRELQLLRTGDGQNMVEHMHHQWIKVRGNQLEIIEVEIATPGGPLAIVRPGKTIVTIGLKQLQKRKYHPGGEHKRSRDARREFNTPPHARGHDPRGKRLG